MPTVIPPPVKDAIRVLYGAVSTLDDVMRTGHATWVLVPGNVTTPEETTIIARWNANDPTYQDPRSAVVWPRAAYQSWQAAWDILMAYAGWWGKRSQWPFGDGERAKSDRVEAGKLPAILAGFAQLTSALLVIQSPSWRPDVSAVAVAAPLVFATGCIAAAAAVRRRYTA